MKFRSGTQVSGCLVAALLSAMATAQSAYVAGPLEGISREAGTLTILGQTHPLESDGVLIFNGRRISMSAFDQLAQVGSLVVIESRAQSEGRNVTSITITSERYVPGASQVLIAGVVDAVDARIGQIRIGELNLDITAAPPEVFSALQVGSAVEIVGIQPAPKGVLLANSISIAPAMQSIGGTGVSASSLSIGGTGRSASSFSIGGTGSDAASLSIGGTGRSASSLSIGGTGRDAASLSIGGTGRSVSSLSIGGTGSDSASLSIGGTGQEVSSLSIGGTGIQSSTSSIGGTGAESL